MEAEIGYGFTEMLRHQNLFRLVPFSEMTNTAYVHNELNLTSAIRLTMSQ